MKHKRLVVTYYKGRPLAAYYWLPGRSGDISARTLRVGPALLVDFDQDGKPIGIEILDPCGVSVSALNELLQSFGYESVTHDDVRKLHAA